MDTGKVFYPESLFYSDSSPSEPYAREFFENNILHYGQLKLLINDIFMLTLFWNPKEIPNPLFLSVGAASGQHYPILAELFPDVNFVFYDPAHFAYSNKHMDINYGPGRFVINRKLFTDEEAAKFVGRNDVFFTSDIRRGSELDVDDLDVTNEVITEDMNMQMRWVEIINPAHAMLKFRLPYINEDKEEILVDYLDGFLLKQPYVSYKSTECRLFPIKRNGTFVKRKWSSILHQDQCFYHNKYLRREKYQNPLTGLNEPIRSDIPNDYDNVAIFYLLKTYLQKMGLSEPTGEELLILFDTIYFGIAKWSEGVMTLKDRREKYVRVFRKKTAQFREGNKTIQFREGNKKK